MIAQCIVGSEALRGYSVRQISRRYVPHELIQHRSPSVPLISQRMVPLCLNPPINSLQSRAGNEAFSWFILDFSILFMYRVTCALHSDSTWLLRRRKSSALDSLFTSMLRLTRKKTSNLHITGSILRAFTCDQWIPFTMDIEYLLPDDNYGWFGHHMIS